ncbi:alpha,alpha-phosphotrehalase [Clostridium saccharoperbutylacetonicum]|uniref:alpha,alpha-phosphotrehalase n=1 Tax=Clostridium saccharoperbutylacetonicum TaxID=36745 RepID=UPI0009839F2E|nr:alpha,alpha-phosphotrehalase [Clostridium saccharoperbutylacetonicum]AQR94910.1 trehalose-6-phosphate hydrolase [Clostridium saccharoperbutylacetonicum]NSB30752.1 trehalose-6-phosphate hydrolase [Clostridium saccharoperbutylacetonicum]
MKDFKKSTIYQIYPKSFYDTNGDGVGDLNGVIEKLDYLKNLGIDYIWLTPFYPSPQVDNGYDIADYYNIDPNFGTLEDFEKLVEEARERNIYIMLDMVLNHTSTEHQWFKKALNGEEKYKAFYFFKEPINNAEPTNWESKFGGNAWQYVEKFDGYYLHLFDKTQADLNWDNEEVRKEIYSIVNFWINKGVKGLRFDVINLISKPEKFENDFNGDGRRFYTDGPRIHEYLKELNQNTFGKHEDIITVGEMSSTSLENCLKYSKPQENELSMVFNFHHLKVDYNNQNKWELKACDFKDLKILFNEWQLGMEEGWNALFWCNHDQPRIVSRFGNDRKYHKESAKMLATMLHLLRGTPYVYQGEEIGMTNAYFTNINQYVDVESLNYFRILKEQGIAEEDIYKVLQERSRDNSRTPMQWNKSLNAGFSDGKPWLSVNDNYNEINVEDSLKDKNSIFYHYKRLISLRKEYDVVAYGTYVPLLNENNNVFAYKREYLEESLIVINNFYETEVTVVLEIEELESYKCIITNYEERNLKQIFSLKPFESIAFLKIN